MASDPKTGNVPFQEAIDFLRAKLRLTSRGWTDVWQEQNAVAFTVAGAQSAAMVADFHEAVTAAIDAGTSIEKFRQEFDAIVERYGWSYRGTRGWRTRTIFGTNLRTSYQAGRWQQAWELRDARPYLRYVPSTAERKRVSHQRWYNIVLPITDDFWRTHYPPNDWGCQCTAQSLSERDLQRRGLKVTSPAPPVVMERRVVETPDGRMTADVPEAIGTGWGYNVGQAAQHARIAQQAARDIGRMPADLGAVVGEAMATATRRALAEDFRTWLAERVQAHPRSDGSWRALGALPPEVVGELARRGAEPPSAGVAITARQLGHLIRDAKAAAGKALSVADLQRLPEIVDTPEATLRDRADGSILLVFTPIDGQEARQGKLVIQLGFVDRVRQRDGERVRAVFNAVKSGGLVPAQALRDPARYELIDGRV